MAALPVQIDAETLARTELSTWRTDAGDLDLLGDIPDREGARRRYEDSSSPTRAASTPTGSRSGSRACRTSSRPRSGRIGQRTERRSLSFDSWQAQNVQEGDRSSRLVTSSERSVRTAVRTIAPQKLVSRGSSGRHPSVTTRWTTTSEVLPGVDGHERRTPENGSARTTDQKVGGSNPSERASNTWSRLRASASAVQSSGRGSQWGSQTLPPGRTYVLAPDYSGVVRWYQGRPWAGSHG